MKTAVCCGWYWIERVFLVRLSGINRSFADSETNYHPPPPAPWKSPSSHVLNSIRWTPTHTQRYAGITEERTKKKREESAPLLPCIPFWAAIIIVMIINERMNCFCFFVFFIYFFFTQEADSVYIMIPVLFFCVVSPLHNTLCLSICNACMYCILTICKPLFLVGFFF